MFGVVWVCVFARGRRPCDVCAELTAFKGRGVIVSLFGKTPEGAAGKNNWYASSTRETNSTLRASGKRFVLGWGPLGLQFLADFCPVLFFLRVFYLGHRLFEKAILQSLAKPLLAPVGATPLLLRLGELPRSLFSPHSEELVHQLCTRRPVGRHGREMTRTHVQVLTLGSSCCRKKKGNYKTTSLSMCSAVKHGAELAVCLC